MSDILNFGFNSASDWSPVFRGYPFLPVKIALWAVALVFAVVILALCICIAVSSKRGRVLAILAGISNFAFCLTVPRSAIQSAQSVRVLMQTLHYTFGYTKAASPTQQISSSALLDLIVSLIGFVTLIVTLVFFICLITRKPRALGIVALIVFVIRSLFIAAGPGAISGFVLGLGSTLAAILEIGALYKITNWITAPIDVLTAIFALLVLTLTFVLALIATIKQKKVACACAAAATVADAVEAPVEEAPAEEA